MVLTIEPGLYIAADETLPAEADPALRGIGIRIEDDVLVTGAGCEIVSHDCPKEAADIEKVMARKSIFV
jgi:Xaa-Pro aminopeptidase